ncbi:hypothetical protein P0F65_21615 [Sphingomonas sp. I4]
MRKTASKLPSRSTDIGSASSSAGDTMVVAMPGSSWRSVAA